MYSIRRLGARDRRRFVLNLSLMLDEGMSAGFWVRGMGWGMGLLIVCGCNPLKFKECRDEMSSSQQVLIDMDDQDVDDVEKSLTSVKKAVSACDGVAGADDVAKLRDAESKLNAQLSGLRARAVHKERPKLSEAELAQLEKKGDRGCPRGQQYEHPQNKKMIRCTGSQVVEMGWAEAVEQFNERRGFSQSVEGTTLRFESGAEVVSFDFASKNSTAPAECVTIVGQPGIAWQELVARATGLQPRVMKLGKPIPTKAGPLGLLVEGNAEQFVIKLGICSATPGQKPYVEPPE